MISVLFQLPDGETHSASMPESRPQEGDFVELGTISGDKKLYRVSRVTWKFFTDANVITSAFAELELAP